MNNPRWAVASLSASMLLSSLGTSIANVALPSLATSFGASFQQVQWVVVAYLLAVTTLIVSVGRLGDMMGRRRLLLAGILVFTAASVLASFAPGLGMLILARLGQGAGAAVMMSLALALIGDIVPKPQTGRAMGLIGTMSAVGTALGPSLGGLLISAWGWRAIFAVCVPFGLMAFVLAYRFLPREGPGKDGQLARFDVGGTVLLGLGLAAYALAVTVGHGQFGTLNFEFLLVAVLATALFVLVERRVQTPLIHIASFRDRGLTASLMNSGIVAATVMATLVVGPFYLARALELSPAAIGIVLSVGPLTTAVVGVPAGRMTDWLGAHRLTLVGLAAMILGAGALSIMPVAMGVGGYLAAVATLTAGYSLFQTANNTAVMTDVQSDRRGVIAGMLSLSRSLGLITGASVMGAVFAFSSVRADVVGASSGVTRGLHATFALALVLLGFSVVTTVVVRNTMNRSLVLPKGRLAVDSAVD